jgi:hypothetical protein
MNVSAYFLSRFSGPENANYRDLGTLGDLGRANIVAKLGVI